MSRPIGTATRPMPPRRVLVAGDIASAALTQAPLAHSRRGTYAAPTDSKAVRSEVKCGRRIVERAFRFHFAHRGYDCRTGAI